MLATRLMDVHELFQLHPQAHLFTVRLWIEEMGNGQQEARMQVKHILSGETRYFREWTLLVAYLLAKVQTGDD